jgi:hypothetical protein
MPFSTRDLERAEAQRRTAEREAEELRYELEEVRRRQERDEADRVERRREAIRGAAPSNRLYRGEVTNAREAMQLYLVSLKDEARRDVPEPEDSDAPDALKGNPWPAWIAEGEQHLREYEETVGAAERALAERWAAAPEGSITKTIGEAILSGDYSTLAI